jgi:hypothetical protein
LWLTGIAVNLMLTEQYFDLAVMAIGSFSLYTLLSDPKEDLHTVS